MQFYIRPDFIRMLKHAERSKIYEISGLRKNSERSVT